MGMALNDKFHENKLIWELLYNHIIGSQALIAIHNHGYYVLLVMIMYYDLYELFQVDNWWDSISIPVLQNSRNCCIKVIYIPTVAAKLS